MFMATGFSRRVIQEKEGKNGPDRKSSRKSGVKMKQAQVKEGPVGLQGWGWGRPGRVCKVNYMGTPCMPGGLGALPKEILT